MTCPLLGKVIGGCKFRPRYHVVNNPAKDITDSQIEQLRQTLYAEEHFNDAIAHLAHGGSTQTYVGDVCIRCGQSALIDPHGGSV